MKGDINVIFFDLFYTLVVPKYNEEKNENDVLNITKDEWERYAEDSELYIKRATGNEKNPEKIIEDIIKKTSIDLNKTEKKEILELRQERFRKSLMNVDPVIIDVLLHIKKKQKKICLVSNADVIDVMYWDKSPLSKLFDNAIFSYEVGCIKPNFKIYNIALKRMKANPENCIFIGDGGSDELKGAKEIGMSTILTEYFLKREKNSSNIKNNFVDYSVQDFKEIVDILF